MRGYRFYEELENKNRKAEKSKGTVVALMLQEDGRGWSPIYLQRMVRTESGWSFSAEAIAAILNRPNSPVCGTAVAIKYLEENCKRISEDKARSIHPALFEYLEG